MSLGDLRDYDVAVIYHMLPGDAQVEAFNESGIGGEVLVCREALVEGDVTGETLDEFFISRAAFHNETANEDPANYNANVASQFKTLIELGGNDEVNLWFEYELFCAVNMWFCMDLLSKTGASVYRVEPTFRTKEDRWDGFERATSEQLSECLTARKKLGAEDLSLGSALWNAFRNGDSAELRRLSNEVSSAFPYLNEICEAAIQKESFPAEVVRQIQAEGITDFNKLFPHFKRRAGVYGFGDSQVKRLVETM